MFSQKLPLVGPGSIKLSYKDLLTRYIQVLPIVLSKHTNASVDILSEMDELPLDEAGELKRNLKEANESLKNLKDQYNESLRHRQVIASELETAKVEVANVQRAARTAKLEVQKLTESLLEKEKQLGYARESVFVLSVVDSSVLN